MQPISIVEFASYLPEQVIENDFFSNALNANRSPMFRGMVRRRHVAPNETAVDMIEKATLKLIDKLNLIASQDIDILLTNVSLPDEAFLGCGANVAHRIGTRPRLVLDLHNTGCVSFIYMMDIASALIRAGKGKNALICNVQNASGRIFAQSEIRKKPQSAVPGDGCGVAYLNASAQNPILSLIHHCHSEYADDMFATTDNGRHYWETGNDQLYLDFPESKIISIIMRANKLVPAVIQEACELAGLPTNGIDALITNQPNPFFLRNWREAIELPKAKHLDTFAEYGNLFGAAMPITFDEALSAGKIKTGDHVVLAGFAHAGDFSAACVLRWQDAIPREGAGCK